MFDCLPSIFIPTFIMDEIIECPVNFLNVFINVKFFEISHDILHYDDNPY